MFKIAIVPKKINGSRIRNVDGNIGRNHPDEQLRIPEPLQKGIVPKGVSSMVPLTRPRKW
jgi:hypothetical protein